MPRTCAPSILSFLFTGNSWRRRAMAVCWIALALVPPATVRAAEPASADPPQVADDVAQLLQDRLYAAAATAIDQALDKPDGPRDYLLYLKGRALLQQREFDAAAGAFDQLARQFPGSPWNRRARFATGLALAAKRDFAQAATVYRTEAESLLAAERKQELAAILREFGDVFFQPPKKGDTPNYAAALPFYEEALKVGLLPGPQLETQFRVARCRQELKEHARAAELFATFVADHPDGPLAIEAGFRRGECSLAAQQTKDARRVWQGLLAAHADSPSPWIAEAAFQLSRTWGLPKPATDADLELGVAALEAFLAKFPTHKLAAQAHVDIALSYVARGRHEKAVRQLTVLLADPRYQAAEAIPQARVLLGQAYRDQAKFAEAIQVWREYLTKHPADAQWSDVQQRVVDAEYLLALDKYRAKDFKTARQVLSEFLVKYPLDHRNPGILVLLGRMNYEQKQWDAAIADWQRVVSKHPQTNEASYAQCMIGAVTERELDRPSEALAVYARVTWGNHAAEAQAAIARLTAKSLSVVTQRVFRSHETPAIKLTTRNIPAVTVRVYRIDPEAYFRKTQRLGGVEDLDIALIAPDATFEFPIPKYAEHRELESTVPLPKPEIAAGVLAVTVGSEELEATTLVLRSDLDVIVKASRSQVFVLAENMRTGKPWPGVRLLISDGKTILAEAATGADGVFQRDLPRADSASAAAGAGDASDDPSAGAADPFADAAKAIPAETPTGADSVFPRDLPRAESAPVAAGSGGEEADPFADPVPSLPDGANLTVLALADGHVSSNAVSLNGSSVAQPLVDQGYLYTDRPAYRAGQQVSFRGCLRGVQADAYRVAAGKKYTLEVLDPRKRLVWQQPVALGKFGTLAGDFPLPPTAVPGEYWISVRDVDGRQYQGSFQVRENRADPVRLQISLSRYVVYRGEDVEGTIRATFPDGTPLRGAQLSCQLADEPVYTATTDDRGRVSFKLSTREFAESQTLKVTAKLPQWNVAAEANAYLAMRGFTVAVRTVRSKFVAGETFTVTVSTKDLEGNPVGQQLKLKVSELVTENGRVNQRPQSEDDIQTAAADGTGRVTLKLDKGGRYRLRAEGTDRRNNPCFGQTTVVVSDERDRKRLLVLADRQDYRAGETAEVNLYWREKPALALVTCEGSRVLGYRLVPLKTGANKLALPMTADLAPNFELAVAVMTEDGRLHQASCPFTVQRDLRVSLDVRRRGGAAGSPVPGEPVEVNVATTDPQGKPVAAEVSLALVEQSLLDQSPGAIPEMGAIFRGLPRTHSVRTGSSVSFAYRPATRLAGTTVLAEAERPQETSLRMPWPAGAGGMGGFFGGPAPNDSQPSPEVQAAASFQELIQWMERAGKPRDEETDEELEEEADGEVETDEKAVADEAEETSGRPGGSVGRPATARTWPAGAERGSGVRLAFGARQPRSDGTPAISESETGYWNPAVVTGNDGRATVVIPLPDRVTAWRLLAQGITVDTLAGDASVEVVATKDLYSQLKLPSAFTDGDEADVVALVHNRLPAEQAVDVTLVTQIGARRAEEKRTVKVAAASVAEVPFHVQLNSRPVGAEGKVLSEMPSEVVFQLALTAGQRKDVLRRAVPIQPYGMAVTVATGSVAEANTTAAVEPPAAMPLASPRLQIVVGATVERSLLDVVLGDDAPACGSPVETAASDLMAALAIRKLSGAAPAAEEHGQQVGRATRGPGQQLDARIRAALGTLLAAQCEKDGGWSWAAGADAADRYVTARVVWALGLAGQAGYPVPKDVREKALRCLADQWAALADDDYESKAMMLYARCVAGQRDFESANGLYRVRSSLPTEALLYLALAMLEMERPANAVELLDLVAKRNLDDAAPAGRPAGTAKPPHDSPTELRSLYALALLSARPQEPKTQELIDWLLARRAAQRWSPDRATGPATLALCRWFGQRRSPAERYALAVSVNNQPAKVLELDASAPSQTIDVPVALLVPGKQQVRFALTGHGRYAYQVRLSGFVPADQLKSTNAACRVERFYTPAPLERDGQPVPRGFDFLKGNLVPFRNELHRLPAGRLGEVELRIVRELPPSVPTEQIEYLIVREPLPAGTAVVESSIRGAFEWFEHEPGAITFYVGNRRKIGSLHYALQGCLPGSYRVSPTQVRSAHRPDQITVAQARQLTVLPQGAESKDPYRLTPQELFALGRRAYDRRLWQEANSLLTELLTQWDLSGDVYRQTVMMLLDVQLELNNAGQTVKHFEIVRDKFPREKIPFAKLLRIGSAYQAIGEHERSFLGYRAIVESLFTSETGVPGFLAAKGEFLRSVDVMARLLREYPPESYTAAARFGLAQQLAAKASQAADDPKLKAAGIGRTELLSRAGRLLEAFLVDHPDDPTADQVAFTAAGGLLELGRYEQAASACEHYARRYPGSELLDSFWYITGYGRFMAGQPDPARELLRKVAAHRPINKSTGQPSDSPNKWPAIYILGQIEHSLGRVAEAIQQYRLVEDRFPDARQSIAAFLQKTIRLPELTTIRPGKPVEVQLEFRNLTACEVKVYRIDLVKFALLRRGLGDVAQINLAGIQPLHEATVKLGEGRDYRDRTHNLPLAAKDEGAYLVVCRGDQQFASGLVLITPLELEVQHDAAAGEVRTAVKDAVTGQGVFDAQVKVIGSAMRQFVTGTTDRRGVFVAQGISNRPTVIAQAGDKRFAFYRSPGTPSDPFESVPPESAAAWNAAQPLPSPSAPLAPKIVAAVEGGKAIGYVVSGPGATAVEQQIERVLDTPTALKFAETPLADVAAAIGQQHGIPVRLDLKALDDVGIGQDTPVTFAARGTSLRSALRLILKQVGLTFMVGNDSLMITTPEECESKLTTVVYPVTDLVSFRDTKGEPWEDYDSLIDLVTSTVQPQSWDCVGGPGSINGFAVGKVNTIVLSQTQEVHREIAALLERLRAVAAQGGGDGQVPTRDRPPAPPGSFGGMGTGGMGGMMGGMGGGFGGGVPPGNMPGAQNQPGVRQPATPQSPSGLLQGLDATKGRLQRGQVEKLQKMYDAGMGGGMGGMGAGGMF